MYDLTREQMFLQMLYEKNVIIQQLQEQVKQLQTQIQQQEVKDANNVSNSGNNRSE